MIARHNSQKKRPCEFCGDPTLFTMSIGRRKAVDVCVPCGERSARRKMLRELTQASQDVPGGYK